MKTDKKPEGLIYTEVYRLFQKFAHNLRSLGKV
jgi:hypothetical protein